MILFFSPKIEISLDLVEFVLDGELYDPIVPNMGFRRDTTTMDAAPPRNSLAASSKNHPYSTEMPSTKVSQPSSWSCFFFCMLCSQLWKLSSFVKFCYLRFVKNSSKSTLLESEARLNYLSIFKGQTELSHDYTVNIWFLVVYLDIIVAVCFLYTEKILHVQHTINM